jgi:hypothetical protein
MTATPNLVAPGAVRVWRGFRLPDLELAQFYTKLGTVFVPATVLMQVDAGLHSYAPTVPAGLPGKPDSVPDETAILFWSSPATYWNGFTRLAVRTYTLTHGGVYLTQNNQSRADFPVPFAGSLVADQPVYLFEKPADWMHGAVAHLVAARPKAVEVPAFLGAAARVLSTIKETIALSGAIACAGTDYLVYWELGPIAPGAQQAPSGIPLLRAALPDWCQSFVAAPTFLPIGLWDEWSGMDVRAGSSFNLQFVRQGERGGEP